MALAERFYLRFFNCCYMGISKIAKKPILLPAGMTASLHDKFLKISLGSKDRMLPVPDGVLVSVSDNACRIDSAAGLSNLSIIGTFASKLKSAVSDAQTPSKKTVNLIGVGFKAFKANGNFLVLSLGFSHLVAVEMPTDLVLEIREANKIDIFGYKERVSSFASDLCSLRPWDPCKRSGVVVEGSYLRRKEGKKK